MTKVLTVAFREFFETIKTKAFILSVVFMPLLILGTVYGERFISNLASQEKQAARVIAVVDEHGGLFERLAAQVEAFNKRNPHRPYNLEPIEPAAEKFDELCGKVQRGQLYACLLVPAAAVTGHGPILTSASSSDSPIKNGLEFVKTEDWEDPAETKDTPADFPEAGGRKNENSGAVAPGHMPAAPPTVAAVLCRKDSQLEAGRQISRMLNEAVIEVRFAAQTPPLDRAVVRWLEADVPLRQVDPATGKEAAGDDTFVRLMTPFAFMFLLWMGTMAVSQGLLTSVIEEKSSRVVEVLLSAVSPLQLMSGKILGVVMVSVVLMTVWCTVGYTGAHARQMDYLVTGYRLAVVGLYFVPGFLLTAATLAAIGSACNTLKDAQGMMFPLSIITIVPMLFWYTISQNPNSGFSLMLSYIPPITPFVMVLRVCADPAIPAWQIVSTLALLWAAVLWAFWAAGKVFRVGVLMYGKAPTPRELLHWLRYA